MLLECFSTVVRSAQFCDAKFDRQGFAANRSPSLPPHVWLKSLANSLFPVESGNKSANKQQMRTQ